MAEQYPNRTDLRNPADKVAKMAAKNQPYGEAGKQLTAQSVVPIAAPPTDQVQQIQPTVTPGSLGDLVRPTERPEEPDTAGMPFGDGPGREVFGAPMNGGIDAGSYEDLLQQVRYVYSKYPNTAILQLIMDLENYQLA